MSASGVGASRRAGRYRPGGSSFCPRVDGVLDDESVLNTGMGPYPPRVAPTLRNV